jgi:hypothetical protein
LAHSSRAASTSAEGAEKSEEAHDEENDDIDVDDGGDVWEVDQETVTDEVLSRH